MNSMNVYSRKKDHGIVIQNGINVTIEVENYHLMATYYLCFLTIKNQIDHV